jgi:hypothetical protein
MLIKLTHNTTHSNSPDCGDIDVIPENLASSLMQPARGLEP